MEFKREILIAFFIASSLLCAQLYAQRYNLSVIKTAEPVKTITWNKDGSYFAYAERNNILLRTTNGYTVVQHIPTYKSDINFLQFSANTQGANADQLASLHASGLLDFRILPEVEPTLTLQTENSNPTVMTYNYNGNYFAVGNENGSVLLYMQNYLTQTAVSQQIGNLGVPVTSLCFSRDNKYLLIGAADNSVSLMEVASRKIVGGYAYNARNKVPILMTADSQSIIMTTGDSTIGFFDLDFNRYNYYTTYHDILSMQISADDRFLIILTDDNVFSYYDMQTHEIKKYIPAFNETKILAYSFDPLCTKLAVSHEDGSLYVLDVASVILDIDQQRTDFTTSETPENITSFDFSNSDVPPAAPAPEPPVEDKVEEKPVTPKKPVTPEPAPKPAEPEAKPAPVTPAPEPAPTPAKKETKKEEKKKETQKETTTTEKKFSIKQIFDKENIKTLYKDGHGIEVNLSVYNISNIPVIIDDVTYKNAYSVAWNGLVSYRNYNLLPPFYFGGTYEMSFGIPGSNYPFKYYNSSGYLRNPFYMQHVFSIPVGFCLYPVKNSLELYVEYNMGCSLSSIWNGRFFKNYLTTKPYPAFDTSVKIGAAWDFINFSVCLRYNAYTKFSFGADLGLLINIGGTRTIGSLIQK